jgi:DNA-binding YbaB/EbfC family protein
MNGGGGLKNMMRQAQNMQKKIAEVQERIGEEEFEASTGGGVVTVTVNGNQEMLDISIDPEVMDPDDVEMLEEMVVGATNQALEKAAEKMNQEVEDITGGMNIPGLT